MKTYCSTTLFALMAFLLFQGCNVTTYEKFSSYITTYYDEEDIAVELTKAGNLEMRSERTKDSKVYQWNSTGGHKVKYDSLCQAHGDLGYNKKRGYIVSPLWGYCSTLHITDMEVVSNADFDAQHPAGTPLNDVVYFISFSPKKYIESGYTYAYKWENAPALFQRESVAYNFRYGEESPNYTPIVQRLSEIDSDELRMLPSQVFGYLIFDQEPSLAKEHQLTITITQRNGKKTEHSVVKTF